ncbi:MAG: hypothetical protein CSA65_02310 [Proteobacteria bacterium]|nr:MAG: hypothetical protein CSA65_02310 [Pseudomonadota bacterium]
MMPLHQRFCGTCGAALTMTSPGHDALDRLDEVLNGRYRLKSLLGIGGNGAVYQAEVVNLGHSVAVKVLHPALLHDATARRRIENEARLASQIDHPNIVSILDFHSTTKLTYLVMEFLSGISLAEVLYEVGYLGVRRTIHIGRQVLAALEASHKVGVLHRDLKPENIYLIARQDELDFVKVLDFGMATVTHLPQEARITAANRICGTPAYMAPEQVRNRALTAQTDLYAVGVLLYECLTGDNPFLTQSASDTMVNHVTLDPRLPSKHCKEAEIPPYLDAVVMRALRKDPKERFVSAEEFRWILEGLVLAQQKTDTGQAHQALQTCGECGKVNIAGAKYCDACGSPLGGKQPLDRATLSPDMITALEASSAEHEAEVELAPTTTTVATSRPVGWSPPMVGRRHELEMLEELLAMGPPPFAQRFIRLIGAPGTGKARLTRELVMSVDNEWKMVWIEPEILPVFASLYPIQRAAARLLNLLLPADDAGLVLDAAAELGVGMQHREGLLELFGMPEDPKGPAAPRRAQRAQAWREIVRCFNRKRPLMLVFQDVHLYDTPSQELVAALVSHELCSSPLCIVATHDPQLLVLWGETRTLTLSGLGRGEAVELVGTFFEHLSVDVDAIGGELGVEELVQNSGGNPLLLSELARLCAVEGRVPRSQGMATVINQRISHLPPRSRMMLHTMAVLGRPASSETLVSMVPDQPEHDEQALRFLSGLGLLVGASNGWRFAHRLHREVAYATTPAAIRQRLHEQAAEAAIEEAQPSSFIAHHLFEAGDSDRAVPYLLRAGRRALHSLDDQLARDVFTRALRLIPPPPYELGGRKPWLNATLGLAIAVHDGGDSAAAARLLRRAAAQAKEAGWGDEAARCDKQATRLRS